MLAEERAITAAAVDDVDVRQFRNHLARQGLDRTGPQPSSEDDLRNFGVVMEFDGRLHPTLFGLLAFGKQPQTFPRATNFWIDCVACCTVLKQAVVRWPRAATDPAGAPPARLP